MCTYQRRVILGGTATTRTTLTASSWTIHALPDWMLRQRSMMKHISHIRVRLWLSRSCRSSANDSGTLVRFSSVASLPCQTYRGRRQEVEKNKQKAKQGKNNVSA